MSRPTYMQLEKLVQFLEENPGIAKGHLRSANARHTTKLKWDEISSNLNSLGGATKDAKSWAKFWADKKYALKKLVAQRNTSAPRTGGGNEYLQPISEIDERLISVMGGASFAEGDQYLSIPLSLPMETGLLIDNIPILHTHSTSPTSQPSASQTVTSQPAASQTVTSQPAVSETVTSQPAAPSTPRRSPRIRARRIQNNALQTERERLIKIEEKRVEAELANAAGWNNLVKAIDNLSNAIIVCGDKIAEALKNH